MQHYLKRNGVHSMQEDTRVIETDDAVAFEMPSNAALKRVAAELDFNRVLKLDDVDDLTQFYALVNKPPLHSVVVRIAPTVARYLLDNTNSRNRPKQHKHSDQLGNIILRDEFGVTGDTLKWSKTGILLDGQHRLFACAESKVNLTTHVVFGLEDDVFDLLDQGKKRTPGDVLAMSGVANYNIVASAVRRVLQINAGAKSNDVHQLTARGVKELSLGRMKDIQEWINEARLINKAFKHSPSLIAGLLYMIGKHDRGVARDFAHEWVHGARIGRNRNFDVLNERFMTVSRTGGGHINHIVRTAMIIQCFNYWNAGIVAKPIGLKFDLKWAFPKLIFDKEAFIKQRKTDAHQDSSLLGAQQRMLDVLAKAADPEGNVELPSGKLAVRANLPVNQVTYVLGTMEEKGWVHCSRRGGRAGVSIWRLRDAGHAQLKAEPQIA